MNSPDTKQQFPARFLSLLAGLTMLTSTGIAQPEPISTDIPEGIDLTADLTYATYGDRMLMADLYRLSGNSELLPAIVMVRGGGWAVGDKEGYGPIAAALALKGFVTASIEYRVSDEATFPAAVHDTKAAVRWLRSNAEEFNINPDAIGVIGGSAGAHLAAYLGVTAGIEELEGEGGHGDASSGVQAVVALAAPSSLLPVGGCNQSSDDPENAVVKFLGEGCSANDSLWAYASPVTHVSADSAPILMIHSEADTVVNFTESLLLGMAYGEHNVPASIHLIPDAPHAFWNFNEWLQDTIDKAADFFHHELQ